MKPSENETLSLRVIEAWLDYRSRLFDNFPGLQVCIRRAGKVILSKAYGYANLDTKRPLTTQDLFHIASHSKTFTSCLVLQLVEQGRLQLSDRVVDYLPELKNHKDKRFTQITIRDLLSNRSGLFREGEDGDFWELHKPFPSREQLIQDVLAEDLVFCPNEVSKYSNIGFSLLGLVIENVMGMPYSKATEPLLRKLKGSHILPDYEEKAACSFADGHTRSFNEGQRVSLRHTAALAFAPATGFCANAEDTSLFFYRLLQGKDLLKEETQRELLSLSWPVRGMQNSRYGLGLCFETFSDMELVGHSGGYPGFSTYTVYCPGTEYVVSLFVNANEAIVAQLMQGLIQIFMKVKATFTEKEAAQAVVTSSLMNKWRAIVVVFTKKKGLCFSLDMPFPGKDTWILTSKDGKEFFCDNQGGYYCLGEPINFTKDKKGDIISVKWAAYTFFLEKVFLENLKKTALKN